MILYVIGKQDVKAWTELSWPKEWTELSWPEVANDEFLSRNLWIFPIHKTVTVLVNMATMFVTVTICYCHWLLVFLNVTIC
jgi:hypothetical protein